MHLDETIAAIATAPGGAARGIVRLSGPHVLACLQHVFPQQTGESLAQTRTAEVIPSSLELSELAAAPLPCEIFFWPNSRSYTRQTVAEIHTLGSPPLLSALLTRVCAAGARPAAPGEFTLRAFLAGRIDLTQAEGVLGVIDAREEADLQNALTQLAGGMAEPLHALRGKLLDLLAHLEAGLDFVEEDIEFITVDELDAILSAAAAEVTELLEKMTARGDVQEAVRIVLVGRPNAGKSSLFNALVGLLPRKAKSPQRVALVSTEAGTTRDYLSARFDLSGASCELIDTAGIDPAVIVDEISQAAQEHSRNHLSAARVKLICLDATSSLNAWEQAQVEEYLEQIQTPLADSASRECGLTDTLLLWTKCDHSDSEPPLKLPGAICTSSHTSKGIPELADRLAEFAVRFSGAGAQSVSATVVRCRESLRQAAIALQAAREMAVAEAGEELVALEVRAALEGLGNVVGAIYTDDVLDRVFCRFCIGK